MYYGRRAIALVGFMLLGLPPAVTAPLPRPSPEFSVNPPEGKPTLLSSLNGKVVVMEFLFVRSPHCLRVARMLNELQAELGPRGFQSIAVAFDAPNAAATGGDLLAPIIEYLRLTYPVGYATRSAVDTYLGRSGNEILNIPQMVVIDRSGTIRAATGAGPNPSLEDANLLRTFVNSLLNEPASAHTTAGN